MRLIPPSTEAISRRSFLGAAGAVLATAAAGPRIAFGSPLSGIDALDAMGQAELVHSKQASASELLEACVARIGRVNPQINAVVSLFLDRARKIARGPLPASPLSGVPYLIKDLVGVKGERQTAGSRLLASYIATDTSPAAEQAIKAGMVVFGKTNTCEFGLLPGTESLLLGAVHNPWNSEYSAGGSSGGAAAAVAAGMLPVAHATDAGGSIRIPASCCGVFGLKTSRFRVPNPDPMEGAPDVEFCVSRTVRDSAMMLSLSEDRRTHAPLKPVGFVGGPASPRLKIAFCTQNMFNQEPDTEVKSLTQDTAKLCESLGHQIIPIKNPIDGEKLLAAFTTIWATPAAFVVGLAKKQHLNPQDVLEPWTLGLAEQLAGKPRTAIGDALQYFKRFQAELNAFLGGYDAWLTPVTFSPAPRLGFLAPSVEFETLYERVSQYVSYTPAHNAAGTPAMSVPLQWTRGGLPVGSQFAAKLGAEGTLLSLAYELEQARPWAGRRPSVSALTG
jgi:amidase